MRKANKNIAPSLDSITIHRGVENTRYFYHTDHLGSSSWISNSSGTAQQYLVYLPFGETLLDRRANTTWNTMFSFSGKERDLETGYSYFGARYYDAGTSIWLSVDPMAEKYPSLNPYAYCGNNPVRYIDPTGMFFTPPERNAAVAYMRGVLGTPYSKLDCSAAASKSVIAAGLPNPKTGKGVGEWKNGVALIAANSRKVNTSDMREGDMATFKNGRSDHKGKNGEFDHIGIISKVTRDDDGNISSFDVLHATSSKGIREQTYDMKKGMSGFELRDVYQWDTPDGNETNNSSTFTIPTQTTISAGKDPTFIEKLQNSKVPILKTVGDILNSVSN